MFGAPKLTDEDVGETDSGGLQGAAKDILEAIKDDDAAALAMALKLAFAACDDDDEDEDSGPDSGE